MPKKKQERFLKKLIPSDFEEETGYRIRLGFFPERFQRVEMGISKIISKPLRWANNRGTP